MISEKTNLLLLLETLLLLVIINRRILVYHHNVSDQSVTPTKGGRTLLVFRNKILHIRFRLGEFHLVHTFSSVLSITSEISIYVA